MATDKAISNLSIRLARQDEGVEMSRFFRAASNGMSDYIASKFRDENETIEQFFEKFFADPEEDYGFTKTWMAELGGHVVGAMNGIPVGTSYDGGEYLDDPVLRPIWELEMPNSWCMQILAVNPAARGLGIGTKLIKLAEREARGHGHSKLSLTVQEESSVAHRLYSKLGFIETDRRKLVAAPPYFEPTGDVIQMVKEL